MERENERGISSAVDRRKFMRLVSSQDNVLHWKRIMNENSQTKPIFYQPK